MEDIDQFMESDADYCEIFSTTNKNANSIYSVYVAAVIRSGYAIKVLRRDNRIFLKKEEP